MRIHAISFQPMSAAQKQRLAALGELHYWDAAVGDDSIAQKAEGAEVLVVTPRLHFDITPHLDSCRFIAWQATGTDALDLNACRAKGITVSNVPGFSTDAVVEHAFALVLGLAKRLERGRPALQQGEWREALAYRTTGLKGATLGLFGYGRIGERLAEVGRAFGMKPIAAVRDPTRRRSAETVGFDELLPASDFLVLAAPANPDTRDLFDAAAFARMKPTAYLINISRGALIKDRDLLAALDAGRPAGAGIDVFRREPPAPDDPLLHHPKVLVSPHVAGGTAESVERLLDESITNVEAFLEGRPRHVIT